MQKQQMKRKARSKIQKTKFSVSDKNYFPMETETAIVKFQKEPSIEKKKEIFVQEIRPSFLKLIENIIYVYKFHILGDVDILKNDCMSALFETLNKFDGDRGHRAFSYFNVIAKNWFIQKVKTSKKKNKSDVCFDGNTVVKLEKLDSECISNSHEQKLIDYEFFLLLKEELPKWKNKFEKPQEKKLMEAVMILLDNPDTIPIFNKKGIYLYLREISGLNTKQIVTNLMKFRKKYDLFKKKYQSEIF